MSSDHVINLQKWVAEFARKNDEAESARLSRAVDLISKHFGVRPHEVAILGLTAGERSLRFLAPDNLRTVGQIPLSSASSLAVRTLREKKPDIVNHFPIVPHSSVFESVPLADQQRGEPIQKIMSSPIVLGSRAIGVLQVSRKGRESEEAGPDFAPPQLRDLKMIADALAPCVLVWQKE